MKSMAMLLIAALSGRIAVLEADPTTATAVAAVQADVDQNESDADAAIALKADIASACSDWHSDCSYRSC